MSGFAAVLVYLAVVVVLLAVYMIVKTRRNRRRPRLGDAEAYEGNLVTASAGELGHESASGTVTVRGHATRTGRRPGYSENTVHIPPGVIGGR
jgi:hypothetical protein